MALKLKNEKIIPAISLDKVHVISWLQTEETEAPYTISIQAKVIIYGHDAEGNRVYDTDGIQYIDIKDWRSIQAQIIGASSPEQQAQLLQMHEAYIAALAYIISANTSLGEVEL